jgi:predicted transglutaminase-like cysteine proteinase
MRTVRATLALASILSCAAMTSPVSAVSLLEHAETRVPTGYVGYCGRNPEACAEIPAAKGRFAPTARQWEIIRGVNTAVNNLIEPQTDQELYAQVEYWTMPETSGDCEDYVLMKRQILAAEGIPISHLLITVVMDEQGEGHAVLTIPTTGGDIVLDNRRDETLTWTDTGYVFVKRQSAANPNRWVSLEAQGQPGAVTVATEN